MEISSIQHARLQCLIHQWIDDNLSNSVNPLIRSTASFRAANAAKEAICAAVESHEMRSAEYKDGDLAGKVR